MKIIVYLGHPAHFHLFKNVIVSLQIKGYDVDVLIKKKDILEDLLEKSNVPYQNILEEGRGDTKLAILIGTLKRTFRLLVFALKNKPRLLVGTSVENSFIGKILNIAVINVNEDDAAVVPLYAKLSYPWADAILNPRVCYSGKWDRKATKYESYHELAYLHPNHFKALASVADTYVNRAKPYVIIRFAKLNAHHDAGIKGINENIAHELIKLLKPQFDIYITSERELESQFEQYRININPKDIHHVMAFADLYIGDSQTMAAEAGVLGVPFIRFNDFVGRIGYLRELEEVYQLGFGIKTNEVDKLYQTIKKLLDMPERKAVFQERRQKMLSEKIDYAKFLTWFIDNYPESSKIMKENPEYQYNFK